MLKQEKQLRIKKQGAVYTPPDLVTQMLALLEYDSPNILRKHILENSCGDGAFLVQIVDIYCRVFLKKNRNLNLLKKHLETYIHGIEIEADAYRKCLLRLDKVATTFGLQGVRWDLHNTDALTLDIYNGKMDFVVGNPPYVRIHNLEKQRLKHFEFTQSGMTDLYFAFFEIGFKQLNSTGKLCYITPSSFFSSKSGEQLRSYIQQQKHLHTVIDLGQASPFGHAMTYTAITLFDNARHFHTLRYKIYKETRFTELPYQAVFQQQTMNFDTPEMLKYLGDINQYYSMHKTPRICVKNGFATLADSVFINRSLSKEKVVIDVLKASTGGWSSCVFPYNKQGSSFSLAELRTNFPQTYAYLIQHKENLAGRSIDNNSQWFLFGRTQGIKDVYKSKIAINTLIKDVDSIKLTLVPAGKGIYSGLYILSPFDFETVRGVICCDEFVRYVRALKKYKSGGYFTFSSKDLEKYLTYTLSSRGNFYEYQYGLFN